METMNQETNSKDIYYKYASEMWMKNKKRYKNKDGSKSIFYYTCKEIGCKESRCLNEKTDPEYESSIKSNYCEYHKQQQQLLEKAAFRKSRTKSSF